MLQEYFMKKVQIQKLQWKPDFRQDFSLSLPGSCVAQHKVISRLPALQKATEQICWDLWHRKFWDFQLQRPRLPGPPRLEISWLNFILASHKARSFKAPGSHNIQMPRFLGQLWFLGTPVPPHPGVSGNPRPATQSQLIRLAVSEPELHFLSQITMNPDKTETWF